MKIYKYKRKVYDLTGKDTTKGFKSGYFLKSNGTEEISSTGLWSITEYQEIPDNESTLNITTNRNTNAAICFYDNSKTYISGIAYSNTIAQAVIIPAGAVYFRMSVHKDDMSLFRAELPAKWRETEGYQYKAGENLIDYTATDVNKGFISGKYLNSNGTVQTPGSGILWNISQYIYVKGISRIRVLIPANTASNPSICYYDDKKTFLSGSAYSARESFAENLPAGTEWIRVSYSENAQTRGWSVYDTSVKWREATAHEYSSGSWD